MNYIDIWVIENFDGDYVKAMQHCVEMAELTQDPEWIPYLEDISARLEEQLPTVTFYDGEGSAKMLGIVILGAIAFWVIVGTYFLN